MFATTFRQVADGHELLVDPQVEQPTSEWLTIQECVFEKQPHKGYVRFVITSLPAGTLIRLNQKLRANDNSLALHEAVDQLREALDKGSWNSIVQVTQNWTADFKKATWKLLTNKEQDEIRILSIKYQEKLDFEERLQNLDPAILKKMVLLLRESGLICKSFKLTNKTSHAELIEKVMPLFDEKEECVRASLTLACAE